jgi:hypothetical protein
MALRTGGLVLRPRAHRRPAPIVRRWSRREPTAPSRPAWSRWRRGWRTSRAARWSALRSRASGARGALPGVPTLDECIAPVYTHLTWQGLLAPAPRPTRWWRACMPPWCKRSSTRRWWSGCPRRASMRKASPARPSALCWTAATSASRRWCRPRASRRGGPLEPHARRKPGHSLNLGAGPPPGGPHVKSPRRRSRPAHRRRPVRPARPWPPRPRWPRWSGSGWPPARRSAAMCA